MAPERERTTGPKRPPLAQNPDQRSSDPNGTEPVEVDRGFPDHPLTDALLDAYGLIEAEWAGIVAAAELEHDREIRRLEDWVPVASVEPGTPVISAAEMGARAVPSCAFGISGTRYLDQWRTHDSGYCSCPDSLSRRLDLPTVGAHRRGASGGASAPPEKGPKYARAALEREAREVADSPTGLRNHNLNRAAWTLARLVPDLLDASTVEAVLVAAGIDTGLPEREARATVQGALRRRGAR